MLGRHTIKHWSSTQPSVTLSSGEAEFYGVVRGAGQGLGYQALLQDLGLELPLRVWTDSSAALGICSRQGLGKLRHLDTHTLWVQQAVRSKRLVLKKVHGEENPADLLTKHSLSKERLLKLTALFGCHFRDGRAESAPLTRTGASSKITLAQADRTLASLSGIEAGCRSRMPHNELSPAALEAQYPSLEVCPDLDLQDLTRLEDDKLYAAGMHVVQRILHEMSVSGRTSGRPPPTTTTPATQQTTTTTATGRRPPTTTTTPPTQPPTTTTTTITVAKPTTAKPTAAAIAALTLRTRRDGYTERISSLLLEEECLDYF